MTRPSQRRRTGSHCSYRLAKGSLTSTQPLVLAGRSPSQSSTVPRASRAEHSPHEPGTPSSFPVNGHPVSHVVGGVTYRNVVLTYRNDVRDGSGRRRRRAGDGDGIGGGGAGEGERGRESGEGRAGVRRGSVTGHRRFRPVCSTFKCDVFVPQN